MSERYRFIPKAVSEKWRSIKKKSVDLVAAGIAAPSLVMGVQAPAQHDIFNSVSQQAIIQTIPAQHNVFVSQVTLAKPEAPPERALEHVTVTGYERDMEEIKRLQEVFDRTLGIDSTGKKLNYNPVLARWKFEKIMRDGATDAKITKFKRYETFQIETVLRERNQAAKSVVKYSIDKEGNIWNDRFPDEPFNLVLQRGIIYQKEHGSKELKREQDEYDGWVNICNFLKDKNTPLHTKVLVFSGPGVVEGTNYPDDFADFYEKVEDPETHEISIRMIRNAIELTYSQMKEIALKKDPRYFDKFEGPIDAWYLRHGITFDPNQDSRTVDEIMDQDIGRRKNAMHEIVFQKILKPCAERINYFIGLDVLCHKLFDPKNFALAYNSILEMNDRVKKALDARDDIRYWEGMWSTEFARFRSMQEQTAWYGRQYIAPIAAACGFSSAFKVDGLGGMAMFQSGNDFITMLALSNSVAKFGLEISVEEKDDLGLRKFKCPACEYENTRPYNEKIPLCENPNPKGCPDRSAVAC